MSNIYFKLSERDREWVEGECRKEGISPVFSQTDGLIGNPEWWEVAIPFATATIPYITKILLKIIENNGPTSITYGDITIEKVPQKDIRMILQRLYNLKEQEEVSSHD